MIRAAPCLVAAVLMLVPPICVRSDEPAADSAVRVVRVSEPEARDPVEVSIAINPTNPDHVIAVSLAQGPKKALARTSNYAYVSTNGGRSWKTVAHHNPQQRVQGDDAVTFTADGLAVRSYIAFDGIRTAKPKRAFAGIFTSTSRDGLTWTNPVAVVDHFNTAEPMEDKPWLRADTAKNSPYRGNLYIAWTKFDVYGSKQPEHKTHIFFSRSTDAGKSWHVPMRISETAGNCLDDSNTVEGAVPAVGPQGEVYVAWAGPRGLCMVKSTDGGRTFGKEQFIAAMPGGWNFPVKGLGRANGLPVTGVDLSDGPRRGTLYLCWADRRHGDPDVFAASSRDGGATWTDPVRVNDDQPGNKKEQFFPWMAVDPADGSVNILYYDRGDLDGTHTRVTLARSIDGGRTFQTHKINQEPFACNGSGFFGDYLGIDAFGGRVAMAWMHYVDAKRLAISAAVVDFHPGSQKVVAAK
ncbi:MAG: exo-alpha-sialidase [Gemmataceae bacterium]|nr:exo-alpha-sialidase [Gemmataceae bacterium]